MVYDLLDEMQITHSVQSEISNRVYARVRVRVRRNETEKNAGR